MPHLFRRRALLPIVVLGSALLLGLAVGMGAELLRPGESVDLPASNGQPYPQALADAADAIEARTATGGQGYRFEVLQVQNVIARPGGPGVMVAPAPSASPVPTDRAYAGGYMTQGIVHPDAFAAQIRDGLEENDPPDYERMFSRWGVIERDGLVWRNDGRGWWKTEVAPGTGFDRISAIRLPLLLRRLIEVEELAPELVAGKQLRHFVGQADSVDWPGIIVPDGLQFTGSPILVDIWLDASGRLDKIHGQTINLNETTFQLVCDTTITFVYDNVPPIGDPTPTQGPKPSPSAAPSATSPASPGASAAASASPNPTPPSLRSRA